MDADAYASDDVGPDLTCGEQAGVPTTVPRLRPVRIAGSSTERFCVPLYSAAACRLESPSADASSAITVTTATCMHGLPVLLRTVVLVLQRWSRQPTSATCTCRGPSASGEGSVLLKGWVMHDPSSSDVTQVISTCIYMPARSLAPVPAIDTALRAAVAFEFLI